VEKKVWYIKCEPMNKFSHVKGDCYTTPTSRMMHSSVLGIETEQKKPDAGSFISSESMNLVFIADSAFLEKRDGFVAPSIPPPNIPTDPTIKFSCTGYYWLLTQRLSAP
jgi:hypothetical protein